MNRREFSLGLSGSVGCTIFAGLPKMVSAFEGCAEIFMQDVFFGLETALSVPVGPQDREELIYAFVAPWCPVCAKMKEDILSGKVPARVRLIPTEPRDAFDRRRILNFALSESPDAVHEFFDRRTRPPLLALEPKAAEMISKLQLTTQHAMRYVCERAGVAFGFPLWGTWTKAAPWISAETLFLMGGWVRDPSGIKDGLNMIPLFDPRPNETLSVVNGILHDARPFGEIIYAKGSGVKARVLPLDTAMPTYCYEEGAGHSYSHIVSVQGEDWYIRNLDANASFVKSKDMYRV